MADIILRGYVQADGRVIIEDKVDLPPGEIWLRVLQETITTPLEEAKRLLSEPEAEMTPEELAEYHRLNRDLLDSSNQ